MIEWVLILSITMVSTTMLMFLSAFIAIPDEASLYYGVEKQKLLLFYNSFNTFYLIISPFLFPIYKKYYIVLVISSISLCSVGCIGRYLVGQNFNHALMMASIVAISHVPIITAPYGLLKLFKPSQQGYAAAIPLFVPTLGVNFAILYGMSYIAAANKDQILPKNAEINQLNLIIAFFSVISTILATCCLISLKEKVDESNRDGQSSNSVCIAIKGECNSIKKQIALLIGWGTILGMNWTYGGMFSYFLSGSNMTEKQIALVGLYANLSSAIFSNLGNWISNNTNFSNSMIIFLLNMVGFFASLFIQASVAIQYPFLQSKIAIILAVVILRAGLSSFVNLALVQFERNGISPVISSLIFFYIANVTNLFGNEVAGLLDGKYALAILSSIIWLSIFIVHLRECQKQPRYVGSIQLANSENEIKDFEMKSEQIEQNSDNTNIIQENQQIN